MVQTIKIRNKTISYTVEHRKIKHPRLELKTGKLVVVAPMNFINIKELINKHSGWVIRKHTEMNLADKNGKKKTLIKRTREAFEEQVMFFVKSYSEKLGCSVNNVFFRPMNSKWGSCSFAGNITINSKLSMLPDEIIRYIVHHEVLHRKIRNHKKEFFKHVKAEFEDYKLTEKELLEYWFAVKSTEQI